MATLKSNNAAIAAMQQMLQERCIAELSFAIKMANPSKNMEGAVNYLCHTIQKSGMCCVDDTAVMNILVHYFDENEIEDCGKVNCNIVDTCSIVFRPGTQPPYECRRSGAWHMLHFFVHEVAAVHNGARLFIGQSRKANSLGR